MVDRDREVQREAASTAALNSSTSTFIVVYAYNTSKWWKVLLRVVQQKPEYKTPESLWFHCAAAVHNTEPDSLI